MWNNRRTIQIINIKSLGIKEIYIIQLIDASLHNLYFLILQVLQAWVICNTIVLFLWKNNKLHKAIKTL